MQAVGYARDQLVATGSPSPGVSLTGTTNTSAGIVFDARGNMWVSDLSGHLYRYDAASLTSSGTPTPAVTIDARAVVISTTRTSLSWPTGIAFDSGGNLWVANRDSTLVRFASGQLVSTSSPTPAATIATGSLRSGLKGLAFDASGALRVGADYDNAATSELRRFTSPGALSESVTPTASVIVTSQGPVDAMFMAFSLAPANLPINTL